MKFIMIGDQDIDSIKKTFFDNSQLNQENKLKNKYTYIDKKAPDIVKPHPFIAGICDYYFVNMCICSFGHEYYRTDIFIP